MEDNHIKVSVVGIDEDRHKYIVEYNGKGGLFVPQIKYQIKEQKPHDLFCIVTESADGHFTIAQDKELLMYQKGYKVGSEVTYRIKHKTSQYYELEDEYGFKAKLQAGYDINPELTPLIRCRIKKLGQNPQVELIERLKAEDSKFSISNKTMEKFLECEDWDAKTLIGLLLSDMNDEVFDAECHNWITKEASKVELSEQSEVLEKMQERFMYVLEQTDILDLCNDLERPIIDRRFTHLIEQTNFYRQALWYIAEEKDREYIDSIFGKLKISGAIYHSKDQFYILICIFLIKPDLFEEYIHTIFNTLHSKQISRWKKEPYRSAWLRLLQYFVRSLYVRNDYLLNSGEASTNLMQALAIQLSLYESNDDLLVDAVFNSSLLYRIASRMNVNDPMFLLSAAFRTLIGELEELPTSQCHLKMSDNPDLLANYIFNEIKTFNEDTIPTTIFESDTIQMRIEDGRIMFLPKGLSSDECKSVLPGSLTLWNGIQFYVPKKDTAVTTGKNLTDLIHFRKVIADTETSLFKPAVAAPKLIEEKKLKAGDKVRIIIEEELEPGIKFGCRIIDEKFRGTGYLIYEEDFLSQFKLPFISMNAFLMDGKNLIIEAQIKEVEKEGYYHFSLKETIRKHVMDEGDKALYSDKYQALVIHKPGKFNRIIAVSEDGLPLSVGFLDKGDFDLVSEGGYINVIGVKPGKKGFLIGDFDSNTNCEFTLNDAFELLILNSAEEIPFVPGSVVEKEEPEIAFAENTVLSQRYFEELINIIERISFIEKDYVSVYCYLGICKIMSRMIGEGEKVKYYSSMMSFIELLRDFSVNDKVEESKVRAIEECNGELFVNNTSLSNNFHKMKIVSYLGKSEHNQDLYALISSNMDDGLKRLASLVLSYNFIHDEGLQAAKDDINNQIRKVLKLKPNETTKKYYGEEDFRTEFKTSIVYPENSMKSNKVAQTRKIMEEICAFLNAEGGTLYLGVNDAGYECGLVNDLKEFGNNRDKYRLYVDNQIVAQLGQEAGHCVETCYDTTESSVLIVKIKPSANAISLKGEYFERMGTSCRKVEDEYKATFLMSKRQMMKIDELFVDEEPQGGKPAEKSEKSGKSEKKTKAEPKMAVESETRIATGSVRNNVRHDYEDGFLGDIRKTIIFLSDTEYYVTDKEEWDEHQLALGIHEDEESGYLILVYEDGGVCKVPMGELMGRTPDKRHNRRSDSRLMFASPASAKDTLLSVIRDNKDNIDIRLDDVSCLEEGNMKSSGRGIVEISNKGILFNDIVDIESVGDRFKRNMNRRVCGSSVKGVECQELIETLRSMGYQVDSWLHS